MFLLQTLLSASSIGLLLLSTWDVRMLLRRFLSHANRASEWLLKAQIKIPTADPSGLWGISSDEGSLSLIALVGRALLCAEHLADEAVACFLFPHDGNSPRPGKALAGRTQHQEAQRAPSQEMTAWLLAAQKWGCCFFGV